MSKFTADFSRAFRKTQVLYGLPKAVKRQATTWSSETLRLLKRSASNMQKSGRGRKTGQLARNVGRRLRGIPRATGSSSGPESGEPCP